MAVSFGTYYMNSNSFSTTSGLWTDDGLTTVAPDGWYQSCGVYREMTGGVLNESVTCPSCVADCGDIVTLSSTQGVYNVEANVGTNTGAILVKFNPQTVGDGILVTYNGATYNKLSSPVDGVHQSNTLGNTTYIGDSGTACAALTALPSSTAGVSDFTYRAGSFNSDGTTSTVDIVVGDVSLSTGSPGECVMVIPKPLGTPSSIDLQITSICSTGDFDVTVECPEFLFAFPACTGPFGNQTQACACHVYDSTYYHAPVTGTIGSPGLYDYVFTDTTGQTPVADGWHKLYDGTPEGKVFRVLDGVITSISSCPSGSSVWEVERCRADGVSETIIASWTGPTLTVGTKVFLTGEPGCLFDVLGTSLGVATDVISATSTLTCADFCSTYLVTNIDTTNILTLEYVSCSGVNTSISLTPGGSSNVCLRSIITQPANITVGWLSCGCTI
jgi:hypothetical protein